MIQTVPPSGTHASVALTAIEILPQIRNRKGLDKESLSELAESIRTHGLIEPIIVAPAAEAGMYRLIAGERRVLAASMAGLHELPAMVRQGTNADLATLQAVENLQREDLAVLDIAEGLKALLSVYKKPGALAKALGKSPSWVSKHLRLTSLKPAIHAAVSEGMGDVETITTLDQLARVKGPEAHALLCRCLTAHANGKLTRAMARDSLAKAKAPAVIGGENDGETTEDGDGDGDGEGSGGRKNGAPAPLNLTRGELVWLQFHLNHLIKQARVVTGGETAILEKVNALLNAAE